MTTIRVEYSHSDQLCTISLDRPHRLNAFDMEMTLALIKAVEEARSETRLLLLKGKGKAFSAGFDLSDVAQQSDGDLAARFLLIERLLQAVHMAPFATLALIQGPCFGAGADLAFACAKRIAAPDAKFRMPGLRFGVVLGVGRLSRGLGADNARYILEGLRTFSADEARSLGFVHDVVPQEGWDEAVEDAFRLSRFLERTAQKALYENTRVDAGDADMAALARSVCEPGLRDRILQFLAESGRRPHTQEQSPNEISKP